MDDGHSPLSKQNYASLAGLTGCWKVICQVLLAHDVFLLPSHCSKGISGPDTDLGLQ